MTPPKYTHYMVERIPNALVTGNTAVQAFTDERVSNPEVRGLMKKISLALDPQMTGLGSRVEMETNAGQVTVPAREVGE